ncbi:Transposase family Tnp2 protein [Rhizoctonia solani]|uniref:Transposase family Tnp2 protein n=1 Tax=Rhizoctonia solani TaxID=456999 RepID=A0A8H8P4C6_9AGAM|nr:Transposase family Tnp2 protein [Rhizoctonia solani]QRW24920.1 Transposase family Tnp2 protein [Rhizoctonia solani]
MSAVARQFPGDKLLKYFGTADSLDNNLELNAGNSEQDVNMGSDKELSTNDLDPSGSQNLDAEDQEETHTYNAIRFHTYKLDGEQSECSDYLRGSWYHIPTPPPSPPSSPPPNQNVPEPLEDEDRFQNLNAIDFCKYDQWYAEPDTGEDVEMHKSHGMIL